MAKYVAIIACLAFVAYLFKTDLRRSEGPTSAIWVPLIWMFLAGSRYASSWLGAGGDMSDAGQYSEGSPLDRLVFLGLIIAGIVILAQRRIDWSQVVHANTVIVLYLIYCLSSAAWSDDPGVLVRRWIKDLGTPIMALVVLTEPRPFEAVAALLRRFTFLVIPMSFVFVRYLPEMARTYHFDGAPMFTGIGHQKNHLGAMCLIAGIYLCWDFFRKRPDGGITFARQHVVLTVIFAVMVLWLIRLSDSKTSLVCLTVACTVILLGRVFGRNPGVFVAAIVGGFVLIGSAEYVFGLKDAVLVALGRNPSLTNRTEVWEIVLRHAQNPLLGAGFMSFWTGDRMAAIWVELGAVILQAHSGYVEQYINLGYIGLLFIALIVASAVFNIVSHMSQDRDAGALRLGIVTMAVLYNVTEAAFYGMNNIWLLLMIASIGIPQSQTRDAAATGELDLKPAGPMPMRAAPALRAQTLHQGATPLQRTQSQAATLRAQQPRTSEANGRFKRQSR